MKKERKSRNKDIALYSSLDAGLGFKESEYYGVFGYDLDCDYYERVGYKAIDIDPKRYQKILGKLSPKQIEVINRRHTHYFRPAKVHKEDYNCNVFLAKIESIKADWNNTFKGLIQREQERIKKPKQLVAADDANFMCGITDYDESSNWAAMTNLRNQMKYAEEVFNIINSLYAQFFHQMASRTFDRTALYDYAGAQGTARDFKNHIYHDKLYCIWHFIKHNSLSTYLKLKEKYPEVLVSEEFQQGYLASKYVKFSEDLILDLINGCGEFFKEYCSCVYNEDYDEAQWNYDDYFLQPMLDYYEMIVNPFGIF